MNTTKSLLAALAILTASSLSFAGSTSGDLDMDGPRLKPKASKTFHTEMEGRESWNITVRGDEEGGDIDCTVYDENGGLIADDSDSTNICLLSGTPRYTGLFYLVVKNNGKKTEAFSITVR